MATARTDVTDKEQTDIENAEFENSVPVFTRSETKIVPKGNGGSPERKVGGVVVPASDRFGSFSENTQGRA